MEPQLWGPHLWKSIHYICLGYPNQPTIQDKINYKNFFTTIGPIIPCLKCSNNYQRHLDELPIDPYLNDKQSLFKWSVLLHNIVNIELHKPVITVEKALELYTGSSIKTKNHDYSLISYIVILILVILIIYLIYKNH